MQTNRILIRHSLLLFQIHRLRPRTRTTTTRRCGCERIRLEHALKCRPIPRKYRFVDLNIFDSNSTFTKIQGTLPRPEERSLNQDRNVSIRKVTRSVLGVNHIQMDCRGS